MDETYYSLQMKGNHGIDITKVDLKMHLFYPKETNIFKFQFIVKGRNTY